MKILVCGGRYYRDYEKVSAELSRYNISLMIQGGATGADKLAKEYAQLNNIPYVEEKADWSLGKKAGPIRNELMLKKYLPDLVIAFPGGRGTDNMVRLAKSYGVETIII